jgi:hypothetical protein
VSFMNSLSEWWRRWFGSSKDGAIRSWASCGTDTLTKSNMPLDLDSMLRRCVSSISEALLRIAADESKHADWLSEKINELGGLLPAVVKTYPTERNSWQYLLDDLEEERQCAADRRLQHAHGRRLRS